ncbi:peptidase domain-containing ABC transporter [Synechococcus elongatus IITB4]|uniref:peptidase domain-containing ABC transporter n=1 Tax=Synechococcus elongatus TaxID=32046 RepID=UPI0030D3CCB4
MVAIPSNLCELLAGQAYFQSYPAAAYEPWREQLQLGKFAVGQPLLPPEQLPSHVLVVLSGQVRVVYQPVGQARGVSLGRFGVGSCLGWAPLLRGCPGEATSGSEAGVVLAIPAAAFLDMLKQLPDLAQSFGSQAAPSEVMSVLQAQSWPSPLTVQEWSGFVQELLPQARVQLIDDARTAPKLHLPSDYDWYVSGNNGSAALGIAIELGDTPPAPKGSLALRLLGLPAGTVARRQTPNPVAAIEESVSPPPTESAIVGSESLWSTAAPAGLSSDLYDDSQRNQKFPVERGNDPVSEAQACLKMIARSLQIPFRRDQIQRVIEEQYRRLKAISLQELAVLLEMQALRSQILQLRLVDLARVPLPALIAWEEGHAVLYAVDATSITLADPRQGLLKLSLADFQQRWGNAGTVLLATKTQFTQSQRFGLSWFWPSIQRYRVRLIEVLIASLVVQLFTLANPLIIQQVIDKVIGQGSLNNLNSFAVLLVILGIFQGLLTSLRTYLFADTTNRIDLKLGSDIIDHLLKLPLRYFERRPVGELSSRVQELEKIRSFLTGTALTTVMDAMFSVIYILVMFFYSWFLTVVALSTVPVFVGITFFASPIVRRQLREKAERNAETQSQLVEVLSGIQTVKAQNIELKARWQWQERYARYIASGFRNINTSTTASSLTGFFNQLSGLLVLWVGVYLVFDNQMSLGQLIAFRIISGYVTQPLLRLAQLWQNFQETGLSLERLADIVDTPQESDSDDQGKIPMPMITGKVEVRNLSFRFGEQGPLQLSNVSLEIPAGEFVGIVGQSGSGKSTLMKLLPRLYLPLEGEILIDGYDISKVELYSLRRQIGIVPQDSLLFQGTVEENISLTKPNATTDEIITASKIAGAHDFIMTLPLGYNTRVGERGGALSGGQRQRIAIARTVLQNPQLLILDEATSALDYDTERQVSINLQQHFRGRTVFFITHRLSTVRHADRIIVMDKGAMVEQGSHDELMELRGRYYCLYRQQDALN